MAEPQLGGDTCEIGAVVVGDCEFFKNHGELMYAFNNANGGEMGPLNNSTDEDVAKIIINLECAALDRWGKGDPSGFLEISASDIVYFDPNLERRIDGHEALAHYYEPIQGEILYERFELLNPKVQVIGDAAVLTFNYISYNASGQQSPWNCTEVYRWTDGKWMIVETHWSYTKSVKV